MPDPIRPDVCRALEWEQIRDEWNLEARNLRSSEEALLNE